jgi:hypothetical protein
VVEDLQRLFARDRKLEALAAFAVLDRNDEVVVPAQPQQ